MLAVTTWILAAALADAQTYSYSYTTEAPTSVCKMDGNSGFSCANIDSSGSCCTTQNCGDTSTCYTPP